VIIENAEQLAEQAKAHTPSNTTSPEFVRRVIGVRAARRQFFGGSLFSDPAWDILLELYALRAEQCRVSVSKLCADAEVPGTTAIRWIDKLEAEGLVERDDDPLDRRRVWVSLSDKGAEAMDAYLEHIARQPTLF
jgi:DNA-binding MarR family transcriptional regulator